MPRRTDRRSRTTRPCCGSPSACRWPNALPCSRSTRPSCTSRTGSARALARRQTRSRCAVSSATTARSPNPSSRCRGIAGWPGTARAGRRRSRRPSSSRNAAGTRSRWPSSARSGSRCSRSTCWPSRPAGGDRAGLRGRAGRPARAVPQLPRLRAGPARRRQRAGVAAGEPRGRAPGRRRRRRRARLHQHRLRPLDAAPEAIARARAAGRDDLLALCLNYRGCAQVLRGDDSGLASLRESLAVALRVGDDVVAARAYINIAYVLWLLARQDELDEILEDGLAFCDVRDLTSHAFNLRCTRAETALLHGRYAEAEALLDALHADVGDAGVLGAVPRRASGVLLSRRGFRTPTGGSRRCWRSRWRRPGSRRTSSRRGIRARHRRWSSGAGSPTAPRTADRSPRR